MNKKNAPYTPFYFLLFIVAIMFAVGWLLYDSLPQNVPIHWNVKGEIDGWMSKPWGVFLIPLVTLGVAMLFPILSSIDPRKGNYELFRKSWIMIQVTILLFFAYMYFSSLLVVLHPEYEIFPFVMTGIGVLFMLIGNYLGKVRQNYFVGIKTPWTLANEDVWNKTHRLGGWCFVIAGIALILNGIVQWHIVVVSVTAFSLAVAFPLIYSYLIFPKKK